MSKKTVEVKKTNLWIAGAVMVAVLILAFVFYFNAGSG